MPISAFFSTGTNLVIQTIDIKFEHNRLYIAATRQRQSLANHHYFLWNSANYRSMVLFILIEVLFFQVQLVTLLALSLVPSWFLGLLIIVKHSSERWCYKQKLEVKMEHMRSKRKPGTPCTSSPTAIVATEMGIEANINLPQAVSRKILSSDSVINEGI